MLGPPPSGMGSPKTSNWRRTTSWNSPSSRADSPGSAVAAGSPGWAGSVRPRAAARTPRARWCRSQSVQSIAWDSLFTRRECGCRGCRRRGCGSEQPDGQRWRIRRPISNASGVLAHDLGVHRLDLLGGAQGPGGDLVAAQHEHGLVGPACRSSRSRGRGCAGVAVARRSRGRAGSRGRGADRTRRRPPAPAAKAARPASDQPRRARPGSRRRRARPGKVVAGEARPGESSPAGSAG